VWQNVDKDGLELARHRGNGKPVAPFGLEASPSEDEEEEEEGDEEKGEEEGKEGEEEGKEGEEEGEEGEEETTKPKKRIPGGRWHCPTMLGIFIYIDRYRLHQRDVATPSRDNVARSRRLCMGRC
jgi:hypothetical protein